MKRTESDHYAVLVELSFEPELRTEQQRPQADVEDLVEAREKIEIAKEKA
jgi:hypothetical protein